MPFIANRCRLETKLVFSYVTLSLLITLMSLGGSRLIQRHADHERLLRAGLVRVTEQLATAAGSVAEEGFSYVVSGDHGEAEQALSKLSELRSRALAMPGAVALTGHEVEALDAVAPAAEQLGHAARTMFAAYESTAHVPTAEYEAYDQAVDELGARIAALHGALSGQIELDLRRAERTADALTLIAGVLALLAGLGIGKVLGRRMTRPIKALRDAALAFGAGREMSPLPLLSRDEVGELTDAFNHMVLQTKEHITTIASAKSRLHDVIASMGEMLVVCDDEGVIAEVNPVASRLSGYREPELRDMRIGSLFSCDDLPGSTLSSTRSPREHDTRLKTASGREVPVRLTISRLEGGGDTGWVCVAQDLTEPQRLETELRQAHKMDAIGRLAGGIAHDFNNMLSIILGYASFLLDGLAETDPTYGPLSEMKVAGERSADLTRQLLSFSRQTALEPTHVELDAAVDATAKMVKRVLPESVVVSFDERRSDCTVEVEPGQIEQIVMNLLINARDAMPTGGTIAIATTRIDTLHGERDARDSIPPGRYARLSVADDGTGMDEATVERIFEPFFTTKEQGKGTGLGLSTVFGIVHRCNGHIFVDSQPGKGTTFRIYLPECLSAEEETRPQRAGVAEAVAGLVIADQARSGSMRIGEVSRLAPGR